jgi:hypothetical protein
VFKIELQSLPYAFQVVKRNWLIYGVDKVYFRMDGGILERHELRRFFTLQRAEACAKGFAERTWALRGPIMAEFKPPTTPTPTEVNDDDELPN